MQLKNPSMNEGEKKRDVGMGMPFKKILRKKKKKKI
jgi:hypothetical protein